MDFRELIIVMRDKESLQCQLPASQVSLMVFALDTALGIEPYYINDYC